MTSYNMYYTVAEQFNPERAWTPDFSTRLFINELFNPTLESGIDVGQEMNVGPEKLGKNNKRRALNKRRASEF